MEEMPDYSSKTVDEVYNKYKSFCLPGVTPDMVNAGPCAIAVAGEGREWRSGRGKLGSKEDG